MEHQVVFHCMDVSKFRPTFRRVNKRVTVGARKILYIVRVGWGVCWLRRVVGIQGQLIEQTPAGIA